MLKGKKQPPICDPSFICRPSIEALLRCRADVSQKSDQEESPLGEAAANGPTELLERLLEAELGWCFTSFVFIFFGEESACAQKKTCEKKK